MNNNMNIPAAPAEPVEPAPAPAAAPGLDSHQLLTVLRALEAGDLSHRMPTNLPGVAGEIAATLNRHMDGMITMMQEHFRITTELASGRYGGQMETPAARGIWRQSAGSLNHLAGVLTGQIRNLRRCVEQLAAGDLSIEYTHPAGGEMKELGEVYNRLLTDLRRLTSGLGELTSSVLVQGRLGGQIDLPTATGQWATLGSDINAMSATLTELIRDSAHVIVCLGRGDASPRVTAEVKGELGEVKKVLNDLAERLAKEGAPA